MHLPFNDYDNKTLALLTNINQVQYRIYSFELKIQLNFSNLKEYYFQAVSNSSFAHEGYLVVYNIDDSGDELKEELSRLHLSFGIGVIKLETNPLESSVLFRARENRLDVRTLDMLVEKNRDFADFIDGINEYVKMHASSSSSKKELLKTIEKKYFDDIYRMKI